MTDAEPNSVLLRGGTLIDGTGAPPHTADVLVSSGRIAAVGTKDAGKVDAAASRAREVLDVAGAVVCPGFIDLHSHADFSVFGSPTALTQVTQGVTTLVTGNCGFSPFPVVPDYAEEIRAHGRFIDDGLTWDWSSAREYADAVERLPLGVNLALQVGHGALRIAAMGHVDRAPTSVEIGRMRQLLAESADDVVGLSSGLIYAPASYADTAELVAVAKQAAAEGLLYSTHIRDEGAGLLEAVNEALTTSRESGVRLEISHLKASGPPNWGMVAEALALVDAARADGVDVGADQYPYTASSTTLTSWLPGWALDGGTTALVARLDDPVQVERIAAELGAKLGRSFHPDRIVVASTPDGPYTRFVGQTIAQAADELDVSSAHAVVELLRGQRGLLGVVHHGMAEDDVRRDHAGPEGGGGQRRSGPRLSGTGTAAPAWARHVHPGVGGVRPRRAGARPPARRTQDDRASRLAVGLVRPGRGPRRCDRRPGGVRPEYSGRPGDVRRSVAAVDGGAAHAGRGYAGPA